MLSKFFQRFSFLYFDNSIIASVVAFVDVFSDFNYYQVRKFTVRLSDEYH